MPDLIQFRRGTAAQWTSSNPILADGEIGFETDTGKTKIGKGTTAWNSLAYRTLQPSITTLTLPSVATPVAPAAGNLTVFGQAIGGRMMLRQIGPSGLDTAFQPFLGRNKVGYWCPPGNATTLPAVLGFTAPTTATSTARNVAATNMFTRMRRLGFVSGSGAASVASSYVTVLQVTQGDGSLGGFHKVIRFGISDASVVATARMLVGVSNLTGAPSNVEPSTLTQHIGVGHGASDTNFKIFYGGSAAQTPIDLGANFPSDTTNTDVYELALFAPVTGGIHYEVSRLNTGHTATGFIAGGSSVTLPDASTLLTYHRCWRTNNTIASVVGFDIMSDYIETDT